MVRINPKQVEWLVVNQPETELYTVEYNGEVQLWSCTVTLEDIETAELGQPFFLEPETYNSLPQTFKDLK
jgi:hypothetical protein